MTTEGLGFEAAFREGFSRVPKDPRIVGTSLGLIIGCAFFQETLQQKCKKDTFGDLGVYSCLST